MADIVSKVCDLCGGKDAVGVVLRVGDEGWQIVDLCKRCMKPLAPLLKAARDTDPPPRPHKRFTKTTLPPQPA